MKNIRESFNETMHISDFLSNGISSMQVDEGLKDVFDMVKSKFKKVWEYLKGIVVKVGTYILPVDETGKIIPAISPLTAGQAYSDGSIDRRSTFVHMDKEGAKITGCKNSLDDALKLYGIYAKGNSLKYYKACRMKTEEYAAENGMTINEVKLQNSDPEAKYNVIVDNDKLKNKIKMVIKSKNLARLMVWGAPGIGKTAILMGVLDEMKSEFPDYRLIVKTLSNETPDNFTLPKYVDVDGTTKAEDVPKTWLPVYKPTGDSAEDSRRDALCGNGLLFIDELSRATPQVLNVILPLVNEGNINGYKLGSGWTIICASNRTEDETSGQSDIGNALANRFAQVYYEPTVNTWRKWAEQQNFISPLLLSWLSMPEGENISGGKFYYMDPNEDNENGDVTKLMCTPRSWTNAMRELAEYAHTGTLEGFSIFDIDKDDIAFVLNQYVPASAIDSFLSFLEVISHIGNFESAVEDIWKGGGKGFKLDKKSLTKVAIPVAQLVCSSHADSLPTAKEFESFADWLVAQNSEQLASYALDSFKNIFIGMLKSDNLRNALISYQEKVRRFGENDRRIVGFNDLFQPFCAKWGISPAGIPDYWEGLKKLIVKYGEAFKAANVDGVDALG